MAHITITDLTKNEELDQQAMRAVTGGMFGNPFFFPPAPFFMPPMPTFPMFPVAPAFPPLNFGAPPLLFPSNPMSGHIINPGHNFGAGTLNQSWSNRQSVMDAAHDAFVSSI